MIRIAFLASNNGSSMRAILRAIGEGRFEAEPCLVVSNRRAARALVFAAEQNILYRCIPTEGVEDAADATLLKALREAAADLVVLSGYLRKLGPRTLSAYEGRVLNVHPALLPKHGGKGMYGRKVHEAVLADRDAQTGATIHLVDAEYDRGRIIAQRALPIEPGDTVESIEKKVMQTEEALFVETVARIARGELALPL
jgi:phosphoribosylglycinamide formyltransferase-1